MIKPTMTHHRSYVNIIKNLKKKIKKLQMENEYYGPNVGGYEDDEGERAEPGVSNGEENVCGDMGTREILQGHHNHPHC